jgi:hypothetical protein
MIAIIKSLVDLYNDAPSLVDSIGKIRTHQIAADEEPPYVILYAVAGSGPDYTFGGSLKFESLVVQFSIFDLTPSPDVILGYQELLQERFDWATLSFTHDAEILPLRCQRTTSGMLMKDPDGVWQITIDYLVEYQK